MAKTKTRHIAGIVIALIIIALDVIYFPFTPYFTPLIVIAVTFAWMQYWLDFFLENRRQKAIESNFPDFVRNLVSSVKSGMPISRAIQHVSDTDYGSLSPYVKKLAFQVEWGIPIHKALLLFGEATNNQVIRRAISTVIEAEMSGGNIEDVLDSITNSLVEIKKIKEKRKAAIFSQMVQSYIIFFVFLAVIIIIQNMLIPYILNIQDTSGGQSLLAQQEVTIKQKVDISFSSIGGFIGSFGGWLVSLNGVFLMLSVIQGLFAGVVIGKLSEGQIKFGLKHSLILCTSALVIISFAQGFIQ